MKKNDGKGFAHEKKEHQGTGDVEEEEAASSDCHGLLSSKPAAMKDNAYGPSRRRHRGDHHDDDDDDPGELMDWPRLLWLGFGLFLTLFAFWLLDSLKDPILGALCENNLERHQPPAKLFSVCLTLSLVCFLEYIAQERKRKKQERVHYALATTTSTSTTSAKTRTDEDVLNGGGRWSRMKTMTAASSRRQDKDDTSDDDDDDDDDRVPASIFASIGLPYCLTFGLMAYLLQFNATVALRDPSKQQQEQQESLFTAETRFGWHVLGYFFFAAIESFGSLMVAAFWSYTNSTLSLHQAERMYGPIIAVAQLGAIAGSTMVTTNVWPKITLIITACLVICLHVIVMTMYSRRFPPNTTTSASTTTNTTSHFTAHAATTNTSSTTSSSIFSGLHLILKHNYVLFILGASCLYEVSLTCLNYQMTLLGWSRFEQERDNDATTPPTTTITFTQFMGHYGQMVNISSLLLSSLVFPFLMRRIGLRYTLVLFPTFLFVVNILAFTTKAARGNLTFLFISISLLKAMTYSVHDPSTELLYLPTHSSIKFQSKFWIDVVGRRIAKAMGSSINTISGNVAGSIRVASAPSLLTALGLVLVCYRVGREFDLLVENGIIVGAAQDDNNNNNMNRPPPSTDEYEAFGLIYNDDDDDNHGDDESSNARGGGNLFRDARAPILELSSASSSFPTTKEKGIGSNVTGGRKSMRSSV